MHVSSRCQRLVNHPSCPLSPTTLSYARWWEGRSIWGNVVNLSRNYARLVLEWAPADKRHVASAAVRWAMAAPHVLRGHIHQLKADSYRVSGDLEASLVHIVCSKSPHNSSPALPQEAAHILRPDELAFLSKWSHPPSGCARAMSMLVSELELRPELQVTRCRGDVWLLLPPDIPQ